jgi:hypothetical protein
VSTPRRRQLDRDDSELRALEQALRGDVQLGDLVALRVVAQCGACGQVAGAGDSFCAGCGRELKAVSPARTAAASDESRDTLVGELTTIQPPA